MEVAGSGGAAGHGEAGGDALHGGGVGPGFGRGGIPCECAGARPSWPRRRKCDVQASRGRQTLKACPPRPSITSATPACASPCSGRRGRWRGASMPRSRPFGLANGQFSLMVALNRPAPPPIGRLAPFLAMDASTLTAAVKPLERRGLVRMVPDAQSRQSRRVQITPEGAALLRAAVPVWRATHEALDATLSEGAPGRAAPGPRADRLSATPPAPPSPRWPRPGGWRRCRAAFHPAPPPRALPPGPPPWRPERGGPAPPPPRRGRSRH